jgi:hypothetical protein
MGIHAPTLAPGCRARSSAAGEPSASSSFARTDRSAPSCGAPRARGVSLAVEERARLAEMTDRDDPEGDAIARLARLARWRAASRSSRWTRRSTASSGSQPTAAGAMSSGRTRPGDAMERRPVPGDGEGHREDQPGDERGGISNRVTSLGVHGNRTSEEGHEVSVCACGRARRSSGTHARARARARARGARTGACASRGEECARKLGAATSPRLGVSQSPSPPSPSPSPWREAGGALLSSETP